MLGKEQIPEGIGPLNVHIGDVLQRSEGISGDRDLDSLCREILVVTQIPDDRKRVIAETIGLQFQPRNIFSIPHIHLSRDYFRILKR